MHEQMGFHGQLASPACVLLSICSPALLGTEHGSARLGLPSLVKHRKHKSWDIRPTTPILFVVVSWSEKMPFSCAKRCRQLEIGFVFFFFFPDLHHAVDMYREGSQE